jgi:ketosteroid isomerase-like protein
MSQENAEVVRRLYEAFLAGVERGDVAAGFDSAEMADDADWIPPAEVAGLPPSYRGRDGFIEFMRMWTEDFDSWSMELERLIDAGEDRVVGVMRQWATGKGSRVPVELHFAIVHELEDGRVVRMRGYLDPADALEAAGLRE